MNRKICLVALLLCFCVSINSQTLSGKVVDDSRTPIESVSVVVLGENGKTPIAFTHTKDDGTFTLDYNSRCRAILFSMFGYAKDTIQIANFSNNQTIILKEKAIRIKEVSIKASQVIEKSDTLTYMVDRFKQGQDKSIADVIKKMPGLDVLKDGSIEYQGKPINKLYIEGMDLLGKKYSQASENIPATKVKSVQVYENHQPVRVLKNASFSEQAALNIVLDDNAKNVWQVLLDVGAGSSLQNGAKFIGDDRVMPMLFARKMQSISLYKFNNTGKNINKEADVSKLFGEQVPTERSLLQNISIEAPELDYERVMFNQSHLVATNWLFKTKKNNDLRFQLSGLFDKSSMQQSTVTTYTDLVGTPEVINDYNADAYRNELSAECMYKVNNNKLYLTNTIQGYMDFNHSDGLALVNGDIVRQYVKPHKSFITEKAEVIRKLDGGKMVSGNMYFSYNYLPGNLLLSDTTSQRLTVNSAYWGASSFYSYMVGKIGGKCTLDVKGYTQRMSIDNDRYDAVDRFTENVTSLSPEFFGSCQYIKWKIRLPLSWLYRHFNNRNRGDFLLQPYAMIDYVPSGHVKCMLSYNYTYQSYDVFRMSEIPVYYDYLSCSRGLGNFDASRIHLLSGDVEYKHSMSGLFASLTCKYIFMPDNALFSGTLDGNIYNRILTSNRADSHSTIVIGKITKSFGTLFSAGVSCYNKHDSFKILVSDCEVPSSINELRLAINLSYQPIRWFSAEAHSYMLKTHQWRGMLSDIPELSDNMISFNHQINLFFMPGKWTFKFKNEFYHSNDNSSSTNYFSDIAVGYKKKNTEYGLIVNNIWGNSKYERKIISTNTSMYIQNRIRGREALASVSFSF